tara:strand:- start:376 stop:813 length:438 start_codon:yes stop_codon:yes gene_type:complete
MELKRYSVTWVETFTLLFLIWAFLGLINILIEISLISMGRDIPDNGLFYRHPYIWNALIISFWIFTKRETIIYKESEEKLEMDNSIVNSSYFLSIIVPFAGMFIFLILASKNEENYRQVGRNCLMLTVFSIIFSGMMLTALMFSY